MNDKTDRHTLYLLPEESEYVLSRYSDCLCAECLRAIQAERERRR
ncbi:MAG: hypothetical protein ACREWE_04965 [Gammaproteobacteria bacterium]